MIYLFLSILFSTITVSMFKVFERKGVDTFQAIVINYIICSLIGNMLAPHTIITQQVWLQPWFIYALALGFLFITIFNFIGQTAQKLGVSVSMVAAKLSVAVPVIFAVVLYHEPVGSAKIAGILVSMLAVYFISRKNNEATHTEKKLWHLPMIVFVGSGCIDSLLNYVEQTFIPPTDADTVISTVFTIAFLLGSIYMIYLIGSGKKKFAFKNVVWGIILGVPNYFSMYFLVKTLEQFHGSYIFPLNNIGIVAASTVVAVLVFNEKLSAKNKAGLALAFLSIVLISLS
ncbi:MAG: EamA family transporter [Bacteroidia bacterium]|nr:EamA family transporter [Bacteroidia bacterium]